ncbi:arylesterase [Daejeonella oryzae]|uniref:arylesterase n=1 Tax=Daejeonella oryzae TaxID=1122943 RepID=UPI000419E37B|nr:arylesterase [Daejeonella oryzae]
MHKLNLLLFPILFTIVCSCGDPKKPSEDTSQNNTDTQTPATDESVKTIIFFGNSLTAGYGVEPSEAFPALIQQKIDSLNLDYTAVNAGLSGETSSGGKSRISWILKNRCDIFVLELGANDGLRGIPVPETTKNLQNIIDQVKAKNPKVKMVLAGMEVPPNMGPKYASDFRNMFPALAKKNNMSFVPFLLEGVAGISDLNQSDGIHPTVEGQKILAENIWKELQPLL